MPPEIQVNLRIIQELLRLVFNGVILVLGDQYLGHLLLADSAFVLFEFKFLPQYTIPAAVRVPTWTNCIVHNELCTNNALF